MKYRIGKTKKFFMVSIAICFDILELILAVFLIGAVLNRFITLLEYFLYLMWFMFSKVQFTKPKNLSRMGGTFLIEMIPVLGALPMFTVGVLMTINNSRREDLENFNNKNAKKYEDAIVRVKKSNKSAR